MPIFRTEKEFEDQVCDYISANNVNPLNCRKVLDFVRQPSLGDYGIADIITLEEHAGKLVLNVIEMKNTPFQESMVFQVGRYLEAVKLGADYRELMPNPLNLDSFFIDEDPREKSIILPNIAVIGSLVCVGCADLSKGILSVFNQMDITIYNAEIEMLSVSFNQMNSKSDYDTSQTGKIQAAIGILAFHFEGDEV